jgi:glycosyltransferase involved in cell wall biosynthesis
MKADWPEGVKLAFGMSRGSVDAYNRGWELATGDVIIQVQDDVEPPTAWDLLIAGSIGDTSIPRVLHVYDGTGLNQNKPWLLTVMIGTMAWFKQRGYMYHPEFVHLYGDDFNSIKAIVENSVIEATDIVFKHVWEGSDFDETARRNYSTDARNFGHAKFVELCEREL